MSAGGGDNGGGDVELNLAPIIDCFTVLITYLLVSASFLSLTVFDAGIAVSGPSSSSDPAAIPPIVIVVEMKEAKLLNIKAAGGAANINLSMDVPMGAAGYDYDGAVAKLKEVGAKYPLPKDITLTAEPKVEYKDMIKAIEVLRKVIPKVLMAG